MPRMIVSIDGVIIKEMPLTKERTTLGRRPYNDIVIDNLAVSGEHAVIHMAGSSVEIEDLGSTNGTYVNARAVKRQTLHTGDTVEMGKYKIRFLQEAEALNPDTSATPDVPPVTPPVTQTAPTIPDPAPLPAFIRVISGTAAGREMPLQKVVTTIGKPGVAIAAITKRQQGFVLAHVEGPDMPLVNGTSIGAFPVLLKDGDRLMLAGTEMQFEQG